MSFEEPQGSATRPSERIDRTNASMPPTSLHKRQLAHSRRSRRVRRFHAGANLPPPKSTGASNHHNPELDAQQRTRGPDRGFEEARTTYIGFEVYGQGRVHAGHVNLHINGGVNHFFGHQGPPNRRPNIFRRIIDMVFNLVGLLERGLTRIYAMSL